MLPCIPPVHNFGFFGGCLSLGGMDSVLTQAPSLIWGCERGLNPKMGPYTHNRNLSDQSVHNMVLLDELSIPVRLDTGDVALSIPIGPRSIYLPILSG